MRRVAALSCLVLNVALCIAAVADMPAAISLALAIPVLLFGPGMAWSMVSADDDLERDLGTWLALSIGLSLSLDILVGLVVYVLGIPVTALSMSIGLLVVDLPLLAMIGTHPAPDAPRRRQLGHHGASGDQVPVQAAEADGVRHGVDSRRHPADPAPPRGAALASLKPTATALSWIVVSLIGVALSAVAIANSSHAASRHQFGGYTMFAAVGPSSRTPTNRVRVKITNHESRAVSYVLTSRSAPVQRLSARARALSSPIHLAAGASVIVTIPGRPRNGCAWVSLYDLGQEHELGSLCVSPME